MIFDANGNAWVTPRRIGFRGEVQTTSHEPAADITFTTPDRQAPAWTEDSASKPFAQPYAKTPAREVGSQLSPQKCHFIGKAPLEKGLNDLPGASAQPSCAPMKPRRISAKPTVRP